MEQVDQYNLGLGRILKWMLLVCKLRRQDIEIRKMKVINHNNLRKQKIEEQAKWNEEKTKALEEFKIQQL